MEARHNSNRRRFVKKFSKIQYLLPLVCVVTSFSYSPTAHAQQNAQLATTGQRSAELQALKEEILIQGKRLEALQRELSIQHARHAALRRAVDADALGSRYGRGIEPGNTATNSTPLRSSRADDDAAAPVGAAPAKQSKESAVTTLFEQPVLLTPKGHYTFEPSFQYSYSSNNRVALVGYSVIPALLVGLIDVREVKRNTLTAAMTGRFGLTNRFEIDAKVPYVYRTDSTVSREIFTGSAIDRVFDTTGRAIGDVELGARYQINDGGVEKPYFIGTLRFKSRTGKDPFSVVTDCTTRCVGNATGTGLPLDLPTGSGFYSLQPGLTWLFASDPAVFFGSLSYTHNFKRDNVSRMVLGGEREMIGSVAPGDILGTNFGLGLALNDKSSFSVGFDFNSIGRTRQNGLPVPGSVRMLLATMLLGYSYRLTDKTTLSVAVGAGLTRDTPDVSLNLKLPITF